MRIFVYCVILFNLRTLLSLFWGDFNFLASEYVRIEPRVSVCVCVCVCVCVSATAQTAGPILTKIHTNPL